MKVFSHPRFRYVFVLWVLLIVGAGAKEARALGSWSVETLPLPANHVRIAAGIAADNSGNVFVFDAGFMPNTYYDDRDYRSYQRLLSRDPQGQWKSVNIYDENIRELPQPGYMVFDAQDNLFVIDTIFDRNSYPNSRERILMRDSQNRWTAASSSLEERQILDYADMETDGLGNLFVIGRGQRGLYGNFPSTATNRLWMRNKEGIWTSIHHPEYHEGVQSAVLEMAVDPSGVVYISSFTFTIGTDFRGKPTYNYRDRHYEKRDPQGNWTLLPTLWNGELERSSKRVKIDRAGNHYLYGDGLVEKIDPEGNVTKFAAPVLNPCGTVQCHPVTYTPQDLTITPDGTLYFISGGKVFQQVPQGGWTEITTSPFEPGAPRVPVRTEVDPQGKLYVFEADRRPTYTTIYNLPYQLPINHHYREPEGEWNFLFTRNSKGDPPGPQVPRDVLTDPAGNLYFIEELLYYRDNSPITQRLLKRDPSGHWSVVGLSGAGHSPTETNYLKFFYDMTMDAAGNLYTLENSVGAHFYNTETRIKRRDPQGNWTLLNAPKPEGTGYYLQYYEYGVQIEADREGKLYLLQEGVKYTSDSREHIPFHQLSLREPNGHWHAIHTYDQNVLPKRIFTDTSDNLYVVLCRRVWVKAEHQGRKEV